MTKSKDIARAKREGPFRQRQEPKKRGICAVPGCSKLYFLEDDDKQLPLCPECLAFFNKLRFFLSSPKGEPSRTKSGLILPGHEDFRATLVGEEVKG